MLPNQLGPLVILVLAPNTSNEELGPGLILVNATLGLEMRWKGAREICDLAGDWRAANPARHVSAFNCMGENFAMGTHNLPRK